MVFDLEEVSDEGLDFRFQVSKDRFKIDLEDCSLNKNVKVDGWLSRLGDDVYLKGRVSTELTLICSRCLDPLAHIVESKLQAHFLPPDQDPASAREVEVHASDIDTEVYEDQRIDLTQSVRDGILLAVPTICLCKEDCKGICHQCGKKLNQGSCGCLEDSFCDPRMEVLKKIKNKLKEGD